MYIDNSYRFDEIDERDYIFTAGSVDLPTKVDLRPYARGIENQGRIGSCVANAAVSCLEILLERMGKFKDLSRLFHYYNLREPYSNLKGQDKGSFTRDALRIAKEKGICTEARWPYNTGSYNVTPPSSCYEEAKDYSVLSYARIVPKNDRTVDDIKFALSKELPVVIGMPISQAWCSLTGPLRAHDYRGINGDSIGGHAMCIVGYDDDLSGFIIENSWGTSWGDNGYGLLKYDVFTKDVVDIWVCTGFIDTKWMEPIKPLILPRFAETYNEWDPVVTHKVEIPVESETKGPYKAEWSIGLLQQGHYSLDIIDDLTVKATMNEGHLYSYIQCRIFDSQEIPQYFDQIVKVGRKSLVKPEPIDPPKPEPVEPKPKKKGGGGAIGLVLAVVVVAAIAASQGGFF